MSWYINVRLDGNVVELSSVAVGVGRYFSDVHVYASNESLMSINGWCLSEEWRRLTLAIFPETEVKFHSYRFLPMWYWP